MSTLRTFLVALIFRLLRCFIAVDSDTIEDGDIVNILGQMRTECVPKYLKSTQCVPNVNFADLFGSTALHITPTWSEFSITVY